TPTTSPRPRAKPPETPQIAAGLKLLRPGLAGGFYLLSPDGQGHREADPAAVAHLLPDGRAPAGDRGRDPPRRGGVQRHERGRVRAALLRRPLRARIAAHPH